MTLPATRPGQPLETIASEIRRELELVEAAWHDAVSHAIHVGELLNEAKSQLKHGEWGEWLDANFPGSRTTATNYMRLARKSADVADLPTVRAAIAHLAEAKPKEGNGAAQAQTEEAFLQYSPRGLIGPKGPSPEAPPVNIPAALAAHDRIKAASDAIRAKAGLPPVPESPTVRAWREQLANGNGHDPLAKAIAQVKKARESHPAAHADFDVALAALRRAQEAD